MSNHSLSPETNFEKDRLSALRNSIKLAPGYIVLISQELVASYFWNGKALEFVCQTRFDSRLEKSKRLSESPGRRSSGKLLHKQEMTEGHAEENVATRDLVTLHMKSLQKAALNRKLPEFYSSKIILFCDKSLHDAVDVALKSRKTKSIRIESVNVLGKFNSDDFNPTSNPSFTAILEAMSKTPAASRKT